MKHNAIVGNIGHFDNEIDMAGLAKIDGIERINIKPQVDEWKFPPVGQPATRSSSWPRVGLLNLGCATGHPSFVMSNSFTNQVMAQMEIFGHRDFYERKVYTLPKHLDEEVARLHLEKLGVKLTTLTEDQADYLGIPVDGPYKPEHYRVLITPVARLRQLSRDIAAQVDATSRGRWADHHDEEEEDDREGEEHEHADQQAVEPVGPNGPGLCSTLAQSRPGPAHHDAHQGLPSRSVLPPPMCLPTQ